MKKRIRADLRKVLLLAGVAALAGFGLNALRDKPLSWQYQDKGERLDGAVARLQAGGAGHRAGDGVDAEEIAGLLKAKANVLLVDVRPDLFYLDGHIPGARNLAREDFETEYPKLKTALNQAGRVIVYCSGNHCEEAELVAAALVKLGHGNIEVYKGGWEEWSAQRRKVEKGTRK